MAAVAITPADLEPFASIETVKALEMIEDALAMAALVAPCINDEDFAYAAAAKAIIRGAILRWNEAGTGAAVTQAAGPYGITVDNKQTRRGMFWPSEIEDLQRLCATSDESGAFTVDGVSACGAIHADICSLYFGALYCSCGADLTLSWPLWEVTYP